MTFRAEIDIMPLKALLDPQGKAVGNSMANIGLSDISNVRIGKHITMEIKATSKEDASEQVEAACNQMLANPVMESFVFEIFNQA